MQLFAAPALVLWPTIELNGYMETLRLLLRNGFVEPGPNDSMSGRRIPWSRLLHQVCDLPKAGFHLRVPLITLVLTFPHAPTTSLPLHAVVTLDDLKVLEFLLETLDHDFLDIHLRRKDHHGYTPLAHAIERVNTRPKLPLDVLHALLERGASLDDTFIEPSRRLWGYTWKKTPIRDMAMRSERADLRELVAKYGVYQSCF